MTWTCVEGIKFKLTDNRTFRTTKCLSGVPRTALVVELYKDRINTGSDHGRVIRKLINSNLFADKMAILSNNPIPAFVKGFTRLDLLRIYR